MRKKIIDKSHFSTIVNRLTCELLEEHDFVSSSVLIGLQPRGVFLAELIRNNILKKTGKKELLFAVIDHTFYRDDLSKRDDVLIPKDTLFSTELQIDDKRVVLVDDVLYTGRSVRSAIEALFANGRPSKIELLTLIDRRFNRELPINANYYGVKVDAFSNEKVSLMWNQNYTQADVFIER